MAGNSNSGRRKSDRDFANMVRIAVNEIGASGKPKLRELAEILVEQGLKGESWAMQVIADRLDGKPAQESTLSIHDKREATDWTREELVEFLRRSESSADDEQADDRIH